MKPFLGALLGRMRSQLIFTIFPPTAILSALIYGRNLTSGYKAASVLKPDGVKIPDASDCVDFASSFWGALVFAYPLVLMHT